MRFQLPWAFFLLPVIVLAAWYAVKWCSGAALRFSSVEHARKSGNSWRIRLRYLPMALRVLALVLLVVGLARPQEGREEVRDVSEGVAIELVVDRSGSMGQEMSYQGSQLNRLDVVKKVFKQFVYGDGKELQGRPNDLMGMVAFARYADTVCPLTLSHGALDHFIDNIALVTRKNEDGTAIGDALALAAARLKTAEEQIEAVNRGAGSWKRLRADGDGASGAVAGIGLPQGQYNIKSKVIILLTDGQNNAGKRSPREAARLAREWGIKVYAIGVGGREAFVTMSTPLGDYKVPAGPGVDEPTLQAIAAETGGAYWVAESAGKLHEVYKEIDKLERTKIEAVRFVDYSEKFHVLVLAALVALCLEQILTSTVFRRIP